VTPDERLDTVLRLFADHQPEELPVVEESGRLVGVVSRRQVMSAYDRELTKRDMAEGIGGRLLGAGVTKVNLGDDFAMVEVDAPSHLCGESLREIGVRSRYGVQVLLVRRLHDETGERVDVVPDPDTSVHLGDRLVLLGRREALALFER
jgi:CIC family chloride channel protein